MSQESMQETWSAVDQYICEKIVPTDAALDAALAGSVAASLPPINVTPATGKFLQLLVKIQRAHNILEIGTLGGYSTIWMARALQPGGRVVTLEFNPKHAAVAQANFERAGVAASIDLRIGRAIDLLPKLADENPAPFDLIFIDADKPSNADYFQWAIKLSRPGTIIIVDNVVRDGEILDPASTDAAVQGTRRFYDYLATESRVSATALQTVGGKGYDGFALTIVNA